MHISWRLPASLAPRPAMKACTRSIVGPSSLNGHLQHPGAATLGEGLEPQPGTSISATVVADGA